MSTNFWGRSPCTNCMNSRYSSSSGSSPESRAEISSSNHKNFQNRFRFIKKKQNRHLIFLISLVQLRNASCVLTVLKPGARYEMNGNYLLWPWSRGEVLPRRCRRPTWTTRDGPCRWSPREWWPSSSSLDWPSLLLLLRSHSLQRYSYSSLRRYLEHPDKLFWKIARFLAFNSQRTAANICHQPCATK